MLINRSSLFRGFVGVGIVAGLHASALAQCPVASNLQVQSRGCSVRLSWQNAPGAGPAINWSVFRNTANSTIGATAIASPASNVFTYDDVPPSRGVTYYYFIRGNGNATCQQNVPISSIVGGQLLPLQIQALSSQQSSCTQVTITWTPFPDATSYVVLRQPVGGGLVPIATVGNVTSYIDASGVPGTHYYYGVFPQTPCGNSTTGGATEIDFPSTPVANTAPASIARLSGQAAIIPFNISTFGIASTTQVLKDGVVIAMDGRIALSGQTLSISPLRSQDSGEYSLRVITPLCGTVITQSAVLAVRNPCPGDFDENGGAPQVADIFAFLSSWFAGCP